MSTAPQRRHSVHSTGPAAQQHHDVRKNKNKPNDAHVSVAVLQLVKVMGTVAQGAACGKQCGGELEEV